MTRYIDADALKKYFSANAKGLLEPTVDAVPVIRCKDCKHWQCDDSESYCDELGIFGTSPTSYCSFAKRKEE